MNDPHQYPNIETAERIDLGHLKRALFDAGLTAMQAYRELDTHPQHADFDAISEFFQKQATAVVKHCAALGAYDHVRRPAPALPAPVVEQSLPERLAQAVQTRADFAQQRTVRRGATEWRRDGAP